jgi:flagellar L-ring protein FlgH
MKMYPVVATLLLLQGCAFSALAAKDKKNPQQSAPLDRYVTEAARAAQGAAAAATPGAIWTPAAQFADLGRDLKASQVNDLVTIVVSEQASAVSTGATKTERQSSTTNTVAALAGMTKSTGPLANLANISGDTKLNGSGTTSRTTTLATTMSARVTGVLPNGYLLVEGSKDVQINSESQTITVRGVVRPADLASDNSVPSNRLAQMEVRLNGKGVVGDAIRRPFILYRLLMGLLPF